QAGVKNVAARGENAIDLDVTPTLECECLNFFTAMFNVANLFLMHRNLVLAQPVRVLLVPTLTLAVRSHDNAGRIREHAKCEVDGLIVRPNDCDSFSADAIPVAILTKKHAMPETFSYSGYLGRNVKNARRHEERSRAVVAVFAPTNEKVVLVLRRHDF